MVTCRCLGLWLRLFLVCCLLAVPVDAAPQSATRALGFSNLVFRPSGGDQIGIAGEDFRVHILEDLRRRGFNAVGAENLVFGSDHGSRADLMLGGTVTELDCRAASAANVSCVMGVEWQVLDIASDAVVYKLLSRGRVLDAPREPAATLGKRLVIANLASLSQRQAFRRLLAPETQAKPTQGYAPAKLRACKAAPRPMPAASEQVLDATVLIQTSRGFGSGFVLGPDGFIVTAAHVVPESSATVKLHDGREYPAAVIRVDRRVDIALLRLAVPEGTAIPCLPLRLEPIGVGADVYAIGSPASRDLSFSVARGIVSGVRLISGVQYLQTDAAVSSGNSGGPLVSATGQAVAIVSFKLVGASVEGVAFGVPLGAGLNALAVTSAETFTSPELLSVAAAPSLPRQQLLVDRPDPRPQLSAGSATVHDTRVQGVGGRKTNPQVKRALFVWGGTAVVTGLTLVLAAALLESASQDRGSTAGDGGITMYRNIGWGSTAVGGVLLGVGFALP